MVSDNLSVLVRALVDAFFRFADLASFADFVVFAFFVFLTDLLVVLCFASVRSVDDDSAVLFSMAGRMVKVARPGVKDIPAERAAESHQERSLGPKSLLPLINHRLIAGTLHSMIGLHSAVG